MPEPILYPKKIPGENLASLSYSLPEKRLVRIRIVPAKRWALILRTIINWEVRDSGEHQEKWDGRDTSGNLLNFRNCSVIMETERILEKSEIDLLRASGEKPMTLRGHLHGIHDPDRCHELSVKFTTDMSAEPLTDKIDVRSIVDEKRRGYGKERGHGVRYYMDYEMIFENEEETGPEFSYELDTKLFGNGNHVFSVSACDHTGHVGTDSVNIYIANHPAPPIGPDFRDHEEEACCGTSNLSFEDQTPPNNGEGPSPKNCGSVISITTGNLSQEHSPFSTGGS